MATLREYYDTDFNKGLSTHRSWEMNDADGNLVNKIVARTHWDFDANAKFWSFFLPNDPGYLGFISAILSTQEVYNCCLSGDKPSVNVSSGYYDYSEKAESADLVFTSRIFFYVDYDVPENERKKIAEVCRSKGLYAITRDAEYAMKKSQYEKPLAFISHDSRDKDSLVRELALELSKLMCPVWYDEYSLRVGDSLRESIETGLKETQKCVVVLSPNYLANDGWSKAEFDSVFTREMLEKENVILPVWHEVSAQEVYEYSPSLANKVALNSSIGVKELARKLSKVIKSENT